MNAARTINVDDAIAWFTDIATRMESTDREKAATVHRAIGVVCNHLADELRAEAKRRQSTGNEPTDERPFDPSEWERLFGEAGRIQAALWDLSLGGDTDAATDVIRPALVEMRDTLAAILPHFDIEAGGSQ